MAMDGTPQLLRSAQLAKVLSVSIGTVYELGREAGSPAVNVSPCKKLNRLRWPMPESLEWCKNRLLTRAEYTVTVHQPRAAQTKAQILAAADDFIRKTKANRRGANARS